MPTKKQFLILALALMLAMIFAAAALANNGGPSSTIPSSGNTTTGAAAGMHGDVAQGQIVFNNNCAVCHGSNGEPTGAFPGLNDVQNPNPNYSIDPQLYDINPALFARNIDPFIQHGSNPGGVPAPMPSFGDSNLLTQEQIADAEAYVMSLSHVTRPVLSLSGNSLTGASFVPGSPVQLYLSGSALGAPVTAGASGNLPATNVTASAGAISANYASVDVYGIYPNGDPTQGDLALDGTNGAAATVTSVAVEPGLSLSQTRVYWASLADYQNGRLSVDYRISNAVNTGTAQNLTVAGSICTSGVTAATTMPVSLGNVAAGSSSQFTLQYNVPAGVVAFKTTVYATAGSGGALFSYPTTYPGS